MQIKEQSENSSGIQINGRILGASFSTGAHFAKGLENSFAKGEGTYTKKLALNWLRPRGITKSEEVELFQGVASVGRRAEADLPSPTPAQLPGE
jgi:hypothetical protein